MRLSSVARAMGSRRLAMALMLAWMAILIVWIIPFEFYGLPDTQIRAVVYREPFFQVLYAVLFFNTVACLLTHSVAVVRRLRRLPSASSLPQTRGSAQRYSRDLAPEKARDALYAEGFRSIVTGEHWVWGVRNRYSPVGTLLFHAGILLCLIGLTLSFDPAQRFEGSLVLAEGETYSGDVAAYLDRPADATGDPPTLGFTVEKVAPRFYKDLLLFTALEADIRAGDRSHHVTLSSPWIPTADTLVNLSDFGYALELVARSEETTEQVREVRKLKAFPSGQMDVIDIPVGTESYRVYVKVYGDYVDRDGAPGVKSFNADNPYLVVSAARALSAGGERMLVSDKLIPVGSGLTLPGAEITFPGLRHYGVFRVVRSPAAPLVLLSLILLGTGTVLRLAFPRVEALITSASDGEKKGTDIEVRSDVYGADSIMSGKLADRMASS